ncbi:MAG: ATP-binding cassette domain-containing protein [Myxococcales bacterium]|nr:ATP-binding cassette domain-containing protein [Myxococcales bacterium]MDH5565197.1 ATP-binding cassette domain-containing protein [Myxococcales bacterium]
MLLRLDAVTRSFGGRTLFRDVSLTVSAGDRIGMVGANGTGKTTLLRIAAGEDAPDAGAVHTGRDVRVGLLKQEIDPRVERSVREEVSRVWSRLDALEREMRDLEAQMEAGARSGAEISPELAEQYDRCRASFELGGGFERQARVERVLDGLGFARDALDRPLGSFSGGWLMRVELAKLLLSAPDVLLLDEPTNHLDLPSIQWFEETLAAYRGGVVVISHDRTFLRRHAGRIAELEAGRCRVYEGGWERYLEQKAERHEQLLARKRNEDRRAAETERFIERFRYKASKARQVQSRIKSLERMERVALEPERGRTLRMRIPPPARAGEIVLQLHGIHKRFADHVVYDGVDLELRRGERVALAGPNGAGKSTLLRIAAGVLAPDAGDRRLGHNAVAAFYAQHQLEALDAGRTVLAELERVARSGDHPRLRGHLGMFLFSGDDVEKKVAVLSGGEKARLALAKLLLRPANLLILDEPTNHLDMASCQVLEEALRGYAGTLLFISHDRALINALATRVIDVRAGLLRSFPGDYDAYQHGLARGTPEPAALEAPAAPSEAKAERMAARAREKQRRRRGEQARRRLEEIERELLALEERLEELTRQLAEPEVYRDADLTRAVAANRAELRAEIEARYAAWERTAAEIESA